MKISDGSTKMDQSVYTLEALNEWHFYRAVRYYQWAILQQNAFSVRIADREYEYVGIQAFDEMNHLYFASKGRMYVLTSRECGNGYLLEENIQPVSTCDITPDQNVVIVTGHGNFAHFIWNQFEALCQIALETESETKTYLLHQEIDTIFPVVDVLPVYQQVNAEMMSASSSMYVGSRHVSQESLHRIKSFLKIHTSSLKLEQRKLVYLDFRGTGKRSLLNEVEFYSRVIQALGEACPDTVFMLGGYNFQTNNAGNVKAKTRALNILNSIEDVIARCEGHVMEVVSGKHLHEFWHLVQNVDFYITHEGTMQHKIGWIFPEKPGLCLIGRKAADAIAKWHENQVEGSAKLHYLNPDYFSVVEESSEHERKKSFMINEMDKAVEDTVALLKKGFE